MRRISFYVFGLVVAGLSSRLAAQRPATDTSLLTVDRIFGSQEFRGGSLAALAWLSAELRTAGQGPGPRSVPPLSAAEPTRVVLQVDRDGDGAAAGVTEAITWRLAGDILRRDAGGGAQPVINGVRALTLAYFDGAGAPTTDPAAVHRVAITLVTRADHATSPRARDLGPVFTTDVHLRNR